MVYYVFFHNTQTTNLLYKFNNENDFIEYYLEKRLQCVKEKAKNNIEFEFETMMITVPMFFKKRMLTVYIDNQTTLTYYVMKLPTFCNIFFEKIFCSFIKL